MSRRAKLIIDTGLLMKMLRGHPLTAMSSDIPADAEIVGWSDDSMNRAGRMILLLESASFADVPVGGLYPDFTPTFTLTISEADGLLAVMQRCPDCPNCTGPEHYEAVRGIVR